MKRLDRESALSLFQTATLEKLKETAQNWRYHHNPHKRVTFILDTNPNYTNVCTADCTFCSFYRKPGAKDAYTKTVEEVMDSFDLAERAGITTVLLQGGLHPDLPLSYYVELIKTARERYPSITCHFFSAPEIYNIAKVASLSYKEVLQALYDAGQRTLPGGGAEILSERVRKRISPKKMAPGAWIEIHRTAHQVGMRSTATMMYGHVETAEDIIEHLDAIRRLQDETGGFTAFVPWSFKSGGNPMGKLVKAWAGVKAYFRILSFSRIYLDNFAHIQASWFSEGKAAGIESLSYGADDFGGLLMEEEVHRATGFINKSTQREIIDLIHQGGFEAAQRNTLYDILKTWPLESLPHEQPLHLEKKENDKLEVLKLAGEKILERWSVV